MGFGLGSLFSSSSSSKSSSSSDTTNTDNKNQVTDGGLATSVSGSDNLIDNTTPEAWEFAYSSLNKTLDVAESVLSSANDANSKVVASVSDNARDTMNFVQERSTTDLVQMVKDVAPWLVGGVFLLNIDKVLKGVKGLFK